MKKLLLLSLIGASLSTAANAGLTDFSDAKPYVAADYSYQAQNDLNYHFLGLTAGVQFNEFLGAEAFWNKSVNKPIGSEDGINVDLDVQYYGIGLTGKYPLADNFYAKGMVGLSAMSAKLSVSVDNESASYSETRSGFISKFGVGYNINKSLAAEVAYNYQSQFGGFNGVNLEIKYSF